MDGCLVGEKKTANTQQRHKDVIFLSEKPRRLSRRQRQILTILTEHDKLPTRTIMDLLYPENLTESQYFSVLRTLKLLAKRGLITRELVGTMWAKAKPK